MIEDIPSAIIEDCDKNRKDGDAMDIDRMDIDEAVNNTNTESDGVDMVRAADSSDSDSSSSYGSSSTIKSTLCRRVGILEADLLEVTNDLYIVNDTLGLNR